MTNTSSRSGVFYTISAFFIWGVVPIYFKTLQTVPAFEIIAHRILWSVVVLAMLLYVLRGFGDLRKVFCQRRLVMKLAVTSALVTVNWIAFVWAVNTGRVLDTSLGHYITPLVNVLLGFLFLGERLRLAQKIAVALAVAGVAYQLWALGHLPWMSLLLAGSFGSYGLLRKQIPVDSINGLLVETLLAAPFALAYLGYLWMSGDIAFGHQSRPIDGLLMFAGMVTAVPLMMYAAGVKRLRLATVGLLMYLVPSMTLMLAVFVYGEPFGHVQAVTFALIWVGLLIYSLDTWLVNRERPASPRPVGHGESPQNPMRKILQ